MVNYAELFQQLEHRILTELEQRMHPLQLRNLMQYSAWSALPAKGFKLQAKNNEVSYGLMLSELDKNFLSSLCDALRLPQPEPDISLKNAKQSLNSKYLLPGLVLYTNGAAGGQPQEVLKASVAVEFLLKASCLFDDIQDQDKISSLTKSQSGEALNLAIILMSLGQQLLSEVVAEFASVGSQENTKLDKFVKTNSDYGKLIGKLAVSLQSAARGQLLDAQEKNFPIELLIEQPDYYLQKAGLKTAAITGFLTELGAALASPDEVKTLYVYQQFGCAFGMVLHLVGDLQDFLTGTHHDVLFSRDLGKSQLTLPIIYAYRDLDSSSRLQMLELWHHIEYCSGDTVAQADYRSKIVELVKSTSAFSETLSLILHYLVQAETRLKELDPTLEKQEHQAMLDTLKNFVRLFQSYCLL